LKWFDESAAGHAGHGERCKKERAFLLDLIQANVASAEAIQ
jgi:hypothetical protein